jgi:hypothetical protein
MTSADVRALTADALAALAEGHTGVNLLVDDPTSRWCAAIGATHLLWRDGPLEEVHAGLGEPGGITDADMMRANVITTRHVAGALARDGWDWAQLATELTDADRPIGELALSEFVGAPNVEGLRRHAFESAQRLNVLAANGWEWLRTFLACSGSMREWFGVPWWPKHVDVFVSQVTDPQTWLARHYTARAATLPRPPLALAQLATGLLSAPELLSAEVLAWCVHDAHLGDVDHHAVKRQWQAAGRPRWAPPSLSAEL